MGEDEDSDRFSDRGTDGWDFSDDDSHDDSQVPDTLEESAGAYLPAGASHTHHNNMEHPHFLPSFLVVLVFGLVFLGAGLIDVFDSFLICLWGVHLFGVLPLLLTLETPIIAWGAIDKSTIDDAHHDLPIYSILVPVYREANMLPQMAKGLAALDYPSDRLDIIILLESDDKRTYQAAQAINWPTGTNLLVVPDGVLRNKPRACNYGLKQARGAFLVIYDAEDIPHPQQLRAAIARFEADTDKLACLQSPLCILPNHHGWLESHFLLEYRQLFGVILPVLCMFNMPIPLGGTSNHFKTSILRDIGGWDPWNLTEDADIGLRLALEGYKIAMIDVPTFENAPHSVKIWMHQRTRWLSGHIQTLGTHGFVFDDWIVKRGVLATLSMMSILLCRLLSGVLIMCCGVLTLCAVLGIRPWHSSTIFLYIALCVYVGIFVVNMRLLRDFPIRHRLFIVFTTPFYWLMTNPAFARACWRIATGNLKWIKTPHKPHTNTHIGPIK